MSPRNSTVDHHDRLAELAEAEQTERTAARDVEAQRAQAEARVAEAHDALIEAHASDGGDVKAAKAAAAKADTNLEELAVRAEAASRRATRAEQERERYEHQHARDLLAELEPQAAEARDRLERAAAELLAADGQWHDISNEVSRLLGQVPGAAARYDAAGQHALQRTVHEAKAARNAEIVKPTPHWRGMKAIEERDQAAVA